MLVLTRKCRESVVVGGSDGFEHVLKVTVLEIGNGRVKLGFDADPVVPIRRSEVWNDFAPGTPRQPVRVIPVGVAAHKG